MLIARGSLFRLFRIRRTRRIAAASALAVLLIAASPIAATRSFAATPCVAGMAGSYPCDNVDLLAFMPLASIGGGNANDIWGWTDPITGSEYAIMGRTSGTSFVDLSDPANPVYLGNLPPHTGNSSWRDIKVYQDHAFIVSEAAGHGMQVFDLSQLSAVTLPPVTFAETAHYDGFGRAHNMVINEDTGYGFVPGSNTCLGGLHMVDISTPTVPLGVGCVSGDGYTHDSQCISYDGPDANYAGQEICFNANEDTLTIVDVSNKALPVQLSKTGFAGSSYVHQGWIASDHRYFLLGDEGDEQGFSNNTRTYIWDLLDLAAPVLIATYTATTAAIDHNQYIHNGYSYQASYRAGLRILDATDLANGNLSEKAFFDIYPADDNAKFNGAWSVYPFFDSGVVIVSGIEQGLFVLQPDLIECIPEPIADAGPDSLICPGDSIAIGTPAQPGNSYLWTPSGLTSAEIIVSPAADTSYTVTATTAECGSAMDSTTVTVADGSTAIGLSEDFEAGATGWTTSGLWHLADPFACGDAAPSTPPTSMYYGQDGSCNYSTGGQTTGTLTSPVIFGVDATSDLSFNYWREVENFENTYDITRVDIINVSSSARTTVFSLDSSTPSLESWQNSGALSLAAFDGLPIQVEFSFDSTDNVSNIYTGWFIDDVEVTSTFACSVCGDDDGDGVCNETDNCLDVANPDQIDSDADGHGNHCDPDLNNDNAVGVPDFNIFRSNFGLACTSGGYNPDADFNSDCAIGVPDFNIFRSYFGGPPGPSGYACAGTVPCPAAPGWDGPDAGESEISEPGISEPELDRQRTRRRAPRFRTRTKMRSR